MMSAKTPHSTMLFIMKWTPWSCSTEDSIKAARNTSNPFSKLAALVLCTSMNTLYRTKIMMAISKRSVGWISSR